MVIWSQAHARGIYKEGFAEQESRKGEMVVTR